MTGLELEALRCRVTLARNPAPRDMRAELDQLQRMIDGRFAAIDRLYREIDQHARAIQTLEEQAAAIGDKLCKTPS